MVEGRVPNATYMLAGLPLLLGLPPPQRAAAAAKHDGQGPAGPAYSITCLQWDPRKERGLASQQATALRSPSAAGAATRGDPFGATQQGSGIPALSADHADTQ